MGVTYVVNPFSNRENIHKGRVDTNITLLEIELLGLSFTWVTLFKDQIVTIVDNLLFYSVIRTVPFKLFVNVFSFLPMNNFSLPIIRVADPYSFHPDPDPAS
jgi:hypothetical protein